jgi:serine phosphatase RsbU (regulator of sigma subunit)
MAVLFSRIGTWFNRLPSSRLRIIFAAIAIIPLIALVAAILISARSSTHSDDCLWEVRKLDGHYAMFVSQVPDGGKADRAGIRTGDRVIAINGRTVPDAPNADNVAQKILNESPVETPIPYLVERDGQLLNLRIELTRIFDVTSWTILLFMTLWFLNGLIVIMTQPRGQVQQRFFFAAAAVVFAFSFPFDPLHTPAAIAFAWGLLQVSFYLFWMRFCMSFPVDQRVLSTPLLRVLFYLPIPIYFFIYLILDRVIPASPSVIRYMAAIFSWALSIVYFGGGIHFMFRGYRQLPPTADRRPITVILIGTVLAGVILLYLVLIRTTAQAAFVLNPELLLPIILVLALPLSFSYAIFKYQVMDFRLVVRATLVYGATMVLIAALYLAIGYGVGQILGSLTGEELKGTVQVFSFVLFLLLLDPVKRKIQTAIENRFFPQRRDYSAQLAAYSSQIMETVGGRAVAELTAMTLKSALDLRSACVLTENSVTGELDLMARASELEPIYIDDVAINHLRHLLCQSHTLIALETLGDPQIGALRERFSYAIGLYAQGKVTGVMLMSRPRDGEALSGSQTPFIAGVAAQGAAALEVARLYEEELARQRYREELATARRIQESLLPAKMPDFPGISISAISHPAQAVGGDYYDVIRLSDERFLIIVADVSGKGLPASLSMAEFHGMVRIASAIYSTPKEILSVLNDHLVQVMERGSFITATMLLFDTGKKTVSFARAGHTPIIRRHGGEVDTLIPSGVALGLGPHEFFHPALQQYTVRYEPGETFILYSDGVSEAMNARREEFGDGRLLDVISGSPAASADAMLNGIFVNIEGFRAGAEQNDDITIVVVRIEREVEQEPTLKIPEERASA